MEIKKTLEYMEEYLPSPRCRKCRTRFMQGEFSAKIREATLSDAPVVLKVHDYETFAEGLHTTDYRLYDGKLYVPALYGRYHNCEKDEYTNPVTVANDLNRLVICGTRASRESVAAEYQHEADKLLILDGIVWIKATEPFYAVQCFGLGGNHGGTALMIDRNRHHAFDEDTYSALERETAVKEAVQIALGRGDTESVAHIQNNSYYIEVLDPSVIKFHRQPRIFQAERIVTSTVNVKTYSYGHAVEIAKKLPESCFVKQNVSWHNNGEMDCDEAFYTEAHVIAQPEQTQEKSLSAAAEASTAPAKQQNVDDDLEISRMLTISTAHVTEEVCDMLRERAYGDLRSSIPFVVYEKSEFGYFIYINKDELEEDIASCECHQSLIDVVKYAAAHGCELLCLDRDGKMIVKGLPIYEW